VEAVSELRSVRRRSFAN